MKDLEKAIKHCEEVAQEKRYEYQECVAVHDMEEAMNCGSNIVLSKIRAEIAEMQLIGYATVNGKREIASKAVMQVIDKYKAGTEDK